MSNHTNKETSIEYESDQLRHTINKRAVHLQRQSNHGLQTTIKMIKTSLILMAAVAVLGQMGATKGDDLHSEFPLDCSNSEGAKRPSAGRQACRDLRVLVEAGPRAKVIGRKVDEEDAAFDCLCGLNSSNFWYKKIMTHSMSLVARAMEEVVKPWDVSNAMQGPLYYRIKLAPKLRTVQATYRREFLRVFGSAYYEHETGKVILDKSLVEKVAQHSCYRLINHPMMTGFVEPTLKALEKSQLATDDKEYSSLTNSAALMRLINLKNFCLNIVGPKEDPSRNDAPSEMPEPY